MTSKALKELGRKIKYFREIKGISQAELARLIDSDQAVISKLESGRNNISVDNLDKIARALNVAISELFEP